MYEVGDERAPVAVIAHGVGSSAEFIVEAFAAPVMSAGYRLVTFDLRGHGDSDPARSPDEHDLDLHVRDLEAVATGARARIAGGVSLGAHAAAVWASHARPDLDGLLLCLPAWTGRADPGTGPHAVVAEEIATRGVAASLERAVADPATPRWIAALLHRDWRRADEDSLRAALIALDGGRAPTQGELAAVDAPAGVVGWDGDPGHPLGEARRWAGALGRGHLVTTSMQRVGEEPAALGSAAVRALLGAIRAGRDTARDAEDA